MKEEATAPAMTSDNQYKDTENISDNEAIEVIIPDNSKLDTTPPLPLSAIPHLMDYINHIAKVYNCPREYITVATMVSVSTAIGKNIKSFDGKYYNYPLLWMMIVGEQGTNKTEPMKQATQPLHNLNIESYEKTLNATTNGEKQYEQIIFGDITPEARNELLHKGRAVLRCLDEIAIIEEQKDRYAKNGETQEELSIYSNNKIYINRKGEAPVLIKEPFMNQMGTIQPDTLVKSFGKELYVNNGYLARWLFAFPDEQIIPMYNEGVLDEDIVNEYNRFIYEIAKSSNLGTVTYTKEAKDLYIDYYNSLQRKKAMTNDSYERGIYSKLQIHIQRWALVTYVARVFDSKLNEGMKITGEIMAYSIECMQYFEYTALKVRNLIMHNRKPIKEMTDSEVIRMFYNRFSNPNMKISDLARSMGKSREYLSKVINKK